MVKRFTLSDVDPNKYGCSGYGIRFDAGSQFSLPIGKWGKKCYFGVGNDLV